MGLPKEILTDKGTIHFQLAETIVSVAEGEADIHNDISPTNSWDGRENESDPEGAPEEGP